MANYLENIFDCVIQGEDEEIGKLIEEVLDEGISANDILKQGLAVPLSPRNLPIKSVQTDTRMMLVQLLDCASSWSVK